MRDAYQKLHFVTPAALVAPALVALAVLVQAGLVENSGETSVALVVMVIAGPFLSHATMRAIWVRERGRLAARRREGRRRRRGAGAVRTLAVHTPYTVPAAMMDALQVALLMLVAAGATAVVLIRAPVRQVMC